MGGRRGALRLAPAASCSSGCGTVPGGGGTAHPCAFRAARANELRVALSRGIHAARAARPGVLKQVRGADGRRQKAHWRAGASCALRPLRQAASPRAAPPHTVRREIIAQYLFSFFSRGLAPFEICAHLRRAPGAVRLVRRALPADPAPWPWGRWAEGLSAPWSARPRLAGGSQISRHISRPNIGHCSG